MAQEEQIIISDLLSYMSCNLSIYEKSVLVKAVQDYYPKGAITDALDILVSSVPMHLHDKLKHQAKNNTTCIIYNYLEHIPKNEMPIFVCRDLNNLPDIELCIQSDKSKEDSVNNIRKQQQNMRSKINEISESVDFLKEQLQSMVHRAIRHHSNETELSELAISKNEPSRNLAYLQQLMYRTNEMGIGDDKAVSGCGTELTHKEIIVENHGDEDQFGEIFASDELDEAHNQRTIKFETEDGHLLMTTSNDAINFDEASGCDAENIHRIEVNADANSTVKKKISHGLKSAAPPGRYFFVKAEKGLTFKCSECNFASKSYMETADHLCEERTSHCGQSESFRCKLCSFVSSQVVDVNIHLFCHDKNSKSGNTDLECYWCSNKSDTSGELSAHLDCHTIIAPFSCLNCSFKTLDIAKLRNHWRRHWEEKGPHEFECQLCYKVCGTRQALSKHKLMHKRKYEHKCTYCGITYKNKSALTQHTLSHTKEKTFSCPFCSMICESIHSLSEHKKTHENSNRNICSICETQCNNRQSYRIHVLSKHPNEKLFQCDMCSYSFHFKRDLQVHRKKHMSSQKFSCDHCPKKFKSKFYSKVHASLVHKNAEMISKV